MEQEHIQKWDPEMDGDRGDHERRRRLEARRPERLQKREFFERNKKIMPDWLARVAWQQQQLAENTVETAGKLHDYAMPHMKRENLEAARQKAKEILAKFSGGSITSAMIRMPK